MNYAVKTPLQLRPLLVGFRKSAGLTQSDMASRLGVTQQTYAQLEAKPESASMDRLFLVLKMLKVNVILTQPSGPTLPADRLPGRSRPLDSPAAAKKTATKPRRITVPETPAASQSITGTAPAGRKVSRKPAAIRVAPVAGTKKREDW